MFCFALAEGSSKTRSMLGVSVPAYTSRAGVQHGMGQDQHTAVQKQVGCFPRLLKKEKAVIKKKNPVKIQIGFASSLAWAETTYMHPTEESSGVLQIWPLIFCFCCIPVPSGV